MIARFYDGDMNLNKKDDKKVCRNTILFYFYYFIFLLKKNGENFFLVQMFYSHLDYWASIMFWMPHQYFYLLFL